MELCHEILHFRFFMKNMEKNYAIYEFPFEFFALCIVFFFMGKTTRVLKVREASSYLANQILVMFKFHLVTFWQACFRQIKMICAKLLIPRCAPSTVFVCLYPKIGCQTPDASPKKGKHMMKICTKKGKIRDKGEMLISFKDPAFQIDLCRSRCRRVEFYTFNVKKHRAFYLDLSKVEGSNNWSLNPIPFYLKGKAMSSACWVEGRGRR